MTVTAVDQSEIAKLQRQQLEAAHECAMLENDDFAYSKGYGARIKELSHTASVARQQLRTLGVEPIALYTDEANRILFGEDGEMT